MRKLLEFDFSAAIDGAIKDRAIKDEAAKIGAAEDEVSAKWLLPPDHLLLIWSSTENLNRLQASSSLSLSLAKVANKALSSAPSLDALKFGVSWAWSVRATWQDRHDGSRGARSTQLGAMVTVQGLPEAVEQVGTAWRSRLPLVMTCWSRLLFMCLVRLCHGCGACGIHGSVHCQNARFVTSQVVVCLDVTGEVYRLHLSYFGTPCLGHAASRYAAKAWASSCIWASLVAEHKAMVYCHGASLLPTATVVPVAFMMAVLRDGKVAPLVPALSHVDHRGRVTSHPP
ncbi:folate-biopterin transporter 8 [Pyrus ussuriensis x Pyrus communis]|uniref:Folate-biopterin transporter 8 n=1 Tax=Pyrus ussuriensis x Pyrus communis TaxID=2448454 RepID=A0A5N5HZ83_9ROSA|nr:folate-biopterin transporter 8 [Pyrus ussuriensis x Pyrus communis]